MFDERWSRDQVMQKAYIHNLTIVRGEVVTLRCHGSRFPDDNNPKRYFKSEFIHTVSKSSILFKFIQFVKCWRNFGVKSERTVSKFQKRKWKFCVVSIYSIKRAREIRSSCRSLAAMNKKCQKKRDASAKLLFCWLKPIAFLPFLLPSPSSLLKLPVVVI